MTKKKLLFSIFCVVLVIVYLVSRSNFFISDQISGAPPYGEPENSVPDVYNFGWNTHWRRPEGPARVGLQVGHWKNDELPGELSRLVGNTGATGGGKSEAEVNLSIAQKTARVLETKGVIVDILPATVPVEYWADVFVAIHADGSLDTEASGYKIAAPWRDLTGKANTLIEHLDEEYGLATQLKKDPNITRNMRGYYAFAWWKYDHAIHPMTTAVIVETGFLTSPADRKIIVDNADVPAQALAQGIISYLEGEKLL